MNLTRSSARSAAVARALHRRRYIESQTPALFDNTPIAHDGLKMTSDAGRMPAVRDPAPPGDPSSPDSIPPTIGRATASLAGPLPLTPSPARLCPCGCGTALGEIHGKPALVCRSFWFSVPYEVRRHVMHGLVDADRVAACRMVLRMAIRHRMAQVGKSDPATEGRAQREVAPRGEPEGSGHAMPGLHNAPITPAAGEELSTSAPVQVAPEESAASGVAAGLPARVVSVDREDGTAMVEIDADDIQPDPDAPLPAYRPKQVTQRGAAAHVAPFCAGLRAEVLEYIQSCGQRGATNEEISEATGIKLQTVCGRVNELQGNDARGLPVLVICGGYRPVKSGAKAKVWVAV